MTNITFKLKIPHVPNFIFIDDGKNGKRQDGFKESPKVSLAELTTEQIDQIAEEFRIAMHQRASIQRKKITDK